MPRHLLYISSWYPQRDRSAGTFIEMQLLALAELGVKTAILQTENITGGAYLRKRLRRQPLLGYRRHPGIMMIDNLVVHKLPLKLFSNPESKQREDVVQQSLRKVQAYIRLHGRPDAIFHHGIFDFCYLTSALAMQLDLPYWYMEHSPNVEQGQIKSRNVWESEADLRAFVHGASRRFTVTQAYASKFEALFGLLFTYVPNVLHSGFFAEKAEIESRLNKQIDRWEGPFQFINVGILEPRKNQALLLDAFAKGFHGQPNVRLVIAGDGALLEALKAKAEALGIADQVDIPGFVGRDELRPLLDTSQAFVLTSTHETFGVVLIEAMARGLPVIAPDIDGPRELVFGGVGTLFRANDVDHLVHQMQWMSTAFGDYDPKHIAETARSRYGPEVFAKALFADY